MIPSNSISDPIQSESPSSIPPSPILRRSTRPHNPPPYLSEYSCKSVSTKPSFGLPYNILDCLEYSHLGPTFQSFVMAVTTTPSELVSFNQVVQFPKWRTAMDKEIEVLVVNNTWTLTQLPAGKSLIGFKWV